MPETEEQRLKRIFVDYSEKKLHRYMKQIQEGKEDEITKMRLLTYVRERVDTADSQLSGCIESGDSKSGCYSDYGKAIGGTNTVIENLKGMRKHKSFYLPCIAELLDSESISMINEINQKVRDRTTYGRRDELVEENSIVIVWSNNSKAWHPYKRIKRGETINLDANMILIKDIRDLSKLGHITSCLEYYPLYSASFEAIYERRETPFFEGIMTWIERQLQKKEHEEDIKRNI